MSDARLCPRFDTCEGVHGAGLTLGQLDEVFRFCTGDHARCPVFAAGDEACGGACGCTEEGDGTDRGAGLEFGGDGLRERADAHGAEGDRGVDARLRLRAS
jgi:hypothetical protein